MGPRKHIATKNSGTGSTSRRNQPPAQPYEGRFISQEREDLYNRDFKDRNIAKGKVVSLDFLSTGSFYVGHKIRALEWSQFICLDDNFFPDLIREFYANLEYRSSSSTLTSKVNDVFISFTLHDLRRFLNLPTDNLVPPPVVSNNWSDLVGFDRRRDLDKLLSNTARAPILEPPEYNKMNLNSKIMQSLVTYNILPHTGSKTYVTRYGAFIMHCIHSEIRLDLAVIIFRHMFAATEKAHMSLPYPSLLTVIFEHFNVGLRGQNVERYTPHDYLDATCIKKMNYRCVDEDANMWLHKSGEPDIHDGSWNPNAQEAPSATPSSSRPRVRRRHDSPSEAFPESSSASQSWEQRLYEQNQVNHDAYMAQLSTMMGSITTLSDSFQSFRTDTSNRFDYIEEKLATWDERFDEHYAATNRDNDDDDDDGDDDMR